MNGGGRIEREYGLGRGRTDLFLIWPRGGTEGPGVPADRFAVECKVLDGSLERTITEGLAQTSGYDGPGRLFARPAVNSARK